MKVPFLDLKAQYKALKEEIDSAVFSVIERTAFICGPFAKQFEQEFAQYVGCGECVGVGNGTDALVAALKGLGIAPGDEVIVPAKTFIATAEAVTLAGGKVVFADIDPISRTLSPEALELAVTPQTRAVVAVHLYGHPADMPRIMKIADAHGLKVVEDCAQAHGAAIDGRRVGTFGDAAAFSFYPGKNLGAYGDAGAVLCDAAAVAEKIRMYVNHGRKDKYGHVFEGTNSRMDGLQAAILSVKLPHLEDWLRARREKAAAYSERLRPLARKGLLDIPQDHPGHVYHLFVIETDRREDLKAFLNENGVSASVHYPDALPRLRAYANQGHKDGDFPIAEKLAARCLSLPVFPELTEEQIDYVCERIEAFYA